MMDKYATLSLALAFPMVMAAQPVFVNASSTLTGITNSGNCTGVVDMDGDGLDDIATLDQGKQLVVFYQRTDGTFQRVAYPQHATQSQWGFAFGDVDRDGHKDLISGGSYDNTFLLRIQARGQSLPLANPSNGSMYMQNMNMMDVDNDGHIDGFGCHDDAAPRIWRNDGSGTLTFAQLIDFATNPTSDMSGNYGSVWTDFDNDGDVDLFIAKCRQGVNQPSDPRRWNRLFVNDGNGNFTDRAAEFGLENRSQSWSVDFGDIDNDGDMDLVVTNHDRSMQLFINDGTGHFVDATVGSGLEYAGFFLQSHFEDFDNDGYLDLLIGGMGVQHYFTNNRNGTFTQETFPLNANKALHSFGVGDLNNDGFPDVFGSYANGYVEPDNGHADRLWLNTPNGNHFLNVVLRGTDSNIDALGARVTLTTPLGTQIREVRSGESYGLVNTFTCHFGLGEHTTVNTLTVRWPSGLEQTWTNIHADQVITIVEGECISDNNTITTDGPAVLCGAGSVTLNAPAGYEYLWSNGATSQSITVTQEGMYTVRLTDEGGCVGHVARYVVQSPDVTPVVSMPDGDVICGGAAVQLVASEGSAYLWSNGATTSSITVTQAGSYSVTVSGTCDNLTSAPVEVVALSKPAMPNAEGVTIPAPATAQLTATGAAPYWYASATAGQHIGTGSPWTTPMVFSTTSFWVADMNEGEPVTEHGGKADRNAGGGAYHQTNAYHLVFNAYEPFVLKSVKVYAESAGSRTIQLVDASGTELGSVTASVPAGESRIDLDLTVPVGTNLGLRCATASPGLWRDQASSALAFPYGLGDMGAIVGTNVSGGTQLNVYYYFYDWEVEGMPALCGSDRRQVTVHVGTVGVDELGDGSINLYPNPANDRLHVQINAVNGPVAVDLLDVTGRAVKHWQLAPVGGLLELSLDGVAPGEYALRLMQANGTAVRKVVVARGH